MDYHNLTTAQRPLVLIPVALVRPHERHDQRHAVELVDRILAAGVFTHPICLDCETMALLDGHHRFRASQMIGFNYIPSVLVDYFGDDITVTAWRKDETVSRGDVLAAAASGKLMPIKTSRHVFCQPIGECRIPINRLSKLLPRKRSWRDAVHHEESLPTSSGPTQCAKAMAHPLARSWDRPSELDATVAEAGGRR